MLQAIEHNTPPPIPIQIAEMGPTNPEPGVIATRPATAPLAAPRTVGLPLKIQSITIQERAAADVESEPTHPQERRPDYAERKIVRRHRFLAIADPPTKYQSCHDSRDARANMNDCATGRVERSHFTHPSLYAPYPMS